MNSLTLTSPAKLNLFLHVLGRRPDGYHDLQTMFQILDIGDTLTLSAHSEAGISVTPAIPGIEEKDNIAFKAAKLLRAYTGCNTGANIHIEKRLPMGGGLGGGSSNAATTLLGLNRLWQTRCTIPELAKLGRELGADVPVFIEGRSAWAEGIGERLTPVDIPQHWYVVLVPDCHVSTATIFSHKDLTRNTPAITVAAFLEKGGKNDCQPLVETLFPQVRDAVDWLSQFGRAQLTGTGACVFASCPSESIANAILAKRPKQLNGFVAQGVNYSPLHQCLP